MAKIAFCLIFLFFTCFVHVHSATPCEGDFLDIKREQQNSAKRITDLENIANQLTARLNNVSYESVPIGFVYVQLPGQPEPFVTWNFRSHWVEITSEYAGLFFRVLGGGSESFGVTQPENSPRLTNVQMQGLNRVDQVNIASNYQWSGFVSTGAIGPNSGVTWGLRYLVSGGEVLPRNTAVRIWKRIS